ncbi:hypothetical protein M4I32_14615 [Microbacterium sp. LRZ72]|uniref:hypothetical protein n=1 Tax=Microbacterium sp. LRZ72 TaxID=2942481 RepID=UPI0029AA88AF|nr:hypothetical protein [Microbacterium sp. LRZ72]MDX2378025.1 hypothetical protein [Microbacterium sp. LRZ72]
MARTENFDIAHLGAVELFTPKFEESLWFFRDLLAMREVARIGDSAYLRCWDEYQLYTIKLTASDTNGVGRSLYRASSEEALERRVAAIEAAGLGHGWREPEVGVGRSYGFEDPDGHLMAIYYDTEHYVPDEKDTPALKNQASAFPGRGVNVRRMDHINYLAADVTKSGEFWRDVMGARESERVVKDEGGYAAWWFRFAQKSYDVVYSEDWTGTRGRFPQGVPSCSSCDRAVAAGCAARVGVDVLRRAWDFAEDVLRDPEKGCRGGSSGGVGAAFETAGVESESDRGRGC